MLRTFIAITCVAIVTVATAHQEPKAAPNDGRQLDASAIHMTVRLVEKHGDVSKVLANPTISAIEGRPFAFAFIVGAEVEGTTPLLEYGTRVEGSITTTKAEAFAVALKLTQGQLVESGDPKTKTVRAMTLDMRTELEPSVTRTFQVDDKTSIEVRIHDNTR